MPLKNQLFNKRLSLSVIAQIIAWLLFFILQYTIGILFGKQPIDYDGIFKFKLLYSFSGCCLILLQFRVYKMVEPHLKAMAVKVGFFVLLAYIISICYMILNTIIGYYVWEQDALKFYWSAYPIKTLRWQIYIILGFSGLYFVTDYAQALRYQREQTLKATALAQAAQLQMLRYQLNPHFLFNALNSIRAMVVKDQAKARDMITELSDFIRYALEGDKMEQVTIGKEMEAIQNFIDIQKIRFGKRLEINIDIQKNAENFKIPCFLIHPLVENAIKYGIQSSEIPLRIKINASIDENKLFIQVSNTGHIVDASNGNNYQDNGTGTGLKNIRQRLQHLYPDKFEFTLTEDTGWVLAVIKIQI